MVVICGKHEYLSMLELKTYNKYVLESDIIPDIMLPKIEAVLDIQFAPWHKWPDEIPARKTKYRDAGIII